MFAYANSKTISHDSYHETSMAFEICHNLETIKNL